MSEKTDSVRQIVFDQQDDFDVLQNTIKQFQENAESSINEVLHGKGTEVIADEIRVKIHPSGRKWKRKKRSSSVANSIVLDEKKSGNLTAVIHSKSGYSYLYFPDDGTTTEHHHGEQHFMLRGTQAKAGKVLQMCVENIIKNANK